MYRFCTAVCYVYIAVMTDPGTLMGGREEGSEPERACMRQRNTI